MKTVRPTRAGAGAVSTGSDGLVLGMEVPIVARRDISSRGASSKSPVTTEHAATFAVAEDLLGADGSVVIAEGTPVAARITRKEHTRLARPGWVEIAFQTTTLADGTQIPLDDSPVRFEGKSRKGGMIAGAVLVSLLFLLRTGGDVTVQAGSTFIARGQVMQIRPSIP